MRKIFLVTFCSLLAACGTATLQNSNNTVLNQTKTIQSPVSAQTEQPKFNPAEVVKVLAELVKINAGGGTEAQIKLTIIEPYHVNSNPPSEKGFIPLEITFESTEGITIGKPIYPKGAMKTFEFSDKPLSVYEGETTIKLPLRADKSAAGQKTLKGKLSFQPCDHEVCYPPQKIDVTLPVTVN